MEQNAIKNNFERQYFTCISNLYGYWISSIIVKRFLWLY